MATVRLGRYEAEEGELPPYCMKCGAPSAGEKVRRFSWYPQWVLLLLVAGLWPALIVSLILTKRITMPVPLCAAHLNHWRWRSQLIWFSFVGLIVLGIGSLVLTTNLGRRGEELTGLVCGLFSVLGLAWLITAAIVQSTAIRPSEITDHRVSLSGVSEQFADRLREHHQQLAAEDIEEEPRRRRRSADRPRRRRDEEDEYFEERP
jgi:hypothetical protein